MRLKGPGLILTVVILVSFIGAGRGMADPPAAAGRKYLLSIGITKYPEKPLNGCVNDALSMKDMLIRQFGFNSNDTTVLADEDATRDGILQGIRDYSEQVGKGDLFVFFYSGHGTLFPDSSSSLQDEDVDLDLSGLRAQGVTLQDGRYDSAIVPIDSKNPRSARSWGNLILDDELNDYFAAMTRKGAIVILISDSCNSGTLAKSVSINERYKFIDPVVALGTKLPSSVDSRNQRFPGSSKPSFEGRYLALTSSQDNQLSIDASFEGKPQGLFTYVLQKVVDQKGSAVTYGDLYTLVKSVVNTASKGTQTPYIDTRFWSVGLDVPAFATLSTLSNSPPPSGGDRLRLILRSRENERIIGGNMALFPRNVSVVPSQITNANTLSVLTTNENGEAMSLPIQLSSGEYMVKALASGFKVFTGKVSVVTRNGIATVLIVLDRE